MWSVRGVKWSPPTPEIKGQVGSTFLRGGSMPAILHCAQRRRDIRNLLSITVVSLEKQGKIYHTACSGFVDLSQSTRRDNISVQSSRQSGSVMNMY